MATATVEFTERDRTVARLIAAGCLGTPELAAALGVSPRTAQTYCDTLRAKLGVRKRLRGQIPAAYARRSGDDPWAP